MPMNASRHYTSDEIEFTKVIMGYWTNFAKTGYSISEKCLVSFLFKVHFFYIAAQQAKIICYLFVTLT